jgi:hypothetical protein
MLVWEIIGAILLSGMFAAGVFILAIAGFLLYALARQLAHGAAKLLRASEKRLIPSPNSIVPLTFSPE